MIIGIGVDLIDCRRLEKSIEGLGQRFLDRVFTKNEQDYCEMRLQRIQGYGKTYAAKEAVLKAISDVRGISWKEIEVCRLPNGKPTVTLTGKALENFSFLIPQGKKGKIDLSLTDEPPFAQAFVVISIEED